MTNKPDWGRNPAIVLIGLIASIIAIFAFITGIQSIRDLSSSDATPAPALQSLATATMKVGMGGDTMVTTEVPRSTSTRRPTTTPTATEMPKPSPTPYIEKIESDFPGMTIQVIDDISDESTGQVVIRVFAASSAVDPYALYVDHAVKDIAGNWQTVGAAGHSIHTYDDGTCVATPLEEGYYTMYYGSGAIDCWGGGEYPYVIFPVFAGKTTVVEITFGVLEVGVLNANGSASTGTSVDIAVEGRDIAGSPIFTECGGGLTDARGIATLVVGEGVYALRYDLGWAEYGDWLREVSVKAGEVKRVVLTITEK
jgi:hypothetical protein